ncbi:MAG: Stf0 sulfotransferase, partial [Thermoleophilaceae bacterium]|nr:Stf0 sulfotransferase [Thermoleophilaceae bacterium]
LGLDPLPAAAVRPPLERQADERSEDWARRYRHDASEVTA